MKERKPLYRQRALERLTVPDHTDTPPRFTPPPRILAQAGLALAGLWLALWLAGF
ncbi:hypothetical protein [Niveispirillum irakense]|uniref:hypothetical protein n=1 Tax=Niveispirillum irakense TaxID=34011 RepID=UPI00041201CB|nr:hypothetical protein [Niveispirillum irakense]